MYTVWTDERWVVYLLEIVCTNLKCLARDSGESMEAEWQGRKCIFINAFCKLLRTFCVHISVVMCMYITAYQSNTAAVSTAAVLTGAYPRAACVQWKPG